MAVASAGLVTLSVTPALASTARVNGAVLEIEARIAQFNDIVAKRSGGSFEIKEQRASGPKMDARAGCSQNSQRVVLCPVTGVSSV